MTLSPRVLLNGRVSALWCICFSIEVLPSFVRFSTQIMAHKKRHRKNDANTWKVSQEVVKDKSTLKSVAHDGGGRTWRWRTSHTTLARISAAAEEGEGRQRSRHFRQRIHGTSFPKVAGVQVPIGDGVYSNRGWRKRRRRRPEALPKVHR
jgi:hypothetical protein